MFHAIHRVLENVQNFHRFFLQEFSIFNSLNTKTLRANDGNHKVLECFINAHLHFFEQSQFEFINWWEFFPFPRWNLHEILQLIVQRIWTALTEMGVEDSTHVISIHSHTWWKIQMETSRRILQTFFALLTAAEIFIVRENCGFREHRIEKKVKFHVFTRFHMTFCSWFIVQRRREKSFWKQGKCWTGEWKLATSHVARGKMKGKYAVGFYVLRVHGMDKNLFVVGVMMWFACFCGKLSGKIRKISRRIWKIIIFFRKIEKNKLKFAHFLFYQEFG